MAFKTQHIQADGSINIDGSIFQWGQPFTGGINYDASLNVLYTGLADVSAWSIKTTSFSSATETLSIFLRSAGTLTPSFANTWLREVSMGNTLYWNGTKFDVSTGFATNTSLSAYVTNASIATAAFAKNASLNLYVQKAGDTMTGKLTIGASLNVISGVSNTEIARFAGSVSDRGLRISSFIVGGTNEIGFDLNAPGAGGSGAISLSVLSVERMRVLDSGRIGFGTTSPISAFEVSTAGAGYWNGSTDWTTQSPPLSTLTISNTTNGGYDSVLLLRQTDNAAATKNAGAIGLVGTGSWTSGNNASQTSDMYFAVRNNAGGITERMRLTSDGKFYVKTIPNSTTSNVVYYNSGTGEMTYGAGGSAPDLSTLDIGSYINPSSYFDSSLYRVFPNPSTGLSNYEARGTWITLTAGEAITAFYAVAINTDGKAYMADADASMGDMPVIALAAAGPVSSGAEGKFLLNGVVYNSAWNWTPGRQVYLYASIDGYLWQTPPSNAGQCVQVLGIATSPDSMIWNPSPDFIVLK